MPSRTSSIAQSRQDHKDNKSQSYYFTEYYKNKLSLADEIHDNLSTTIKFKNAIKIFIESQEVITSNEVFAGLKNVLNSNFNCIKTCMQFKSNKVWIVAFNDNFASSKLYNQSILISNIECNTLGVKIWTN